MEIENVRRQRRHRRRGAHGGRLVQRSLRQHPGPRTRRGRHQGGARARQGRSGEVDEVIFGQILTAGQGQNPARQAAMAAGIPQEKTAWGLNQLCGSGLRTVAVGMQQIANGDAKIIVAGGQESMSQAPHAAYMRGGTKMGDLKMSRHHAQGRPDGRLPRLPHGHHRRERRAEMAAHPRGAGRIRRAVPEQGRGRPEGRQVQGRDRPLHDLDPQGRHDRRPGRIHPRRHDGRVARQAETRLLQGRHRHRRQCIGHQ